MFSAIFRRTYLKSSILILLLSSIAVGGGHASEMINEFHYVIVVRDIEKSRWAAVQSKLDLNDYVQYSASGKIEPKQGRIDNMVGFFSSRKEALAVLMRIRTASKEKIKLIIRELNETDKNHLHKWLQINNKKTVDSQQKRLTRLAEQARQAMIKKEYRVAVTIYTKIIGFDNRKYSQPALEYLGLARERLNQIAHAINEYRRYLQLYPEGEGARRVKQRLDGLMMAAMSPRKKLKKYKKRPLKSGWMKVGNLTQSYRTDREIKTPIGKKREFTNIYSNFFYLTRLKTAEYELKNQISLSNNINLARSDEDNDRIRISYLYSESTFKKLGISGRVGRQRQNEAGVFGRFDGAVLSYSVTDKLKISATSGYPVSFQSYQRIQEEKPFYSTNVEFESLFGLFDLNTYFITQYNDTLLDRKAIGLDLRHFSQTRTLFANIDYDISYKVINNLLINARARMNKKNSVGTTMTFRRSPLLTTGNSLQGQLAGSLGELLKENEEEVIRQLARDRTTKYISLTLNWKQYIRKNIEISHDYTISQLGSTIASGNVQALDGTGYEDFFSSQFIASDLWTKNDMLLVGLTHANMDTNERTALAITRRDQLNGKLFLTTKLRAEYQERSDGSFIKRVKPAVKVNYRYTHKYKFDAEIGVDRRYEENSFDEGLHQTLFFNIGYTAQF